MRETGIIESWVSGFAAVILEAGTKGTLEYKRIRESGLIAYTKNRPQKKVFKTEAKIFAHRDIKTKRKGSHF